MKSTSIRFGQRKWAVVAPFLAFSVTFAGLGLSGDSATAQTRKTRFSSAKDWDLKGENLKPTGDNPWFGPVKPGFRFIMENPSSDDGYYRKEVIVLDKTEPFDIPGIGKFECAVVQEEEFIDGVYVQQSLNWTAVDAVTNNVYIFGELSWEVDDEGHRVFEGTWRAGEPDGNGLAEPGILMPGTPLVGAKYIFDGHEAEAFGGSEIMETGLTQTTPAGTFENCIRIREYGITDPEDITDKVWAPGGVGIVFDTSDGNLIASDGLPKSDIESFAKYHRNPVKRVVLSVEDAKVTGPQAAEIALKEVPGTANSLTVEKKRGKTCYVVEVIAENGGEVDVFVDILTGEVIGTDR